MDEAMTKPIFHRPECFRVFIFFPDGTSHPEGIFDDAQAAVARARDFMSRPAMMLGMIPRIIVTDGDDNTVFEFKHGEGITFPLTDITRKWNETYLKQHKETSK